MKDNAIYKFIKDGWVVVDFPDLSVVREITDFMGNATHDRLQELSEGLWKKEFSYRIGMALCEYVGALLGSYPHDIMVQYFPYLRIVRSKERKDNIGYHKDTQYGQTPYELAVHVPLVDLDEKSAIRVITGSHVMHEGVFTRVTADGATVDKGSIENQMGKPYLPKCLSVPEGMEATPIPLKVGQALIFSPALFHGQEMNEGDITRVSLDLRFVDRNAPMEIRKGKIHAGYMPLFQTAVNHVAESYYQAQKGNA